MIRPSGSSIELAMHCLHAFTSGLPWFDDDGARGNFGNANHDVAEISINGDQPALAAIASARELTAEERARFVRSAPHVLAHVRELILDGWLLFAEVPVAYDAETGRSRILPSRHHRDYTYRRPGELGATLDVVAVRRGQVAVFDWKTSVWAPVEDLPWQLRSGAVAVANLVGADAVDTAVLYVDEDGVRPVPFHLDALDLVFSAADLKRLWRRLHAGPTPPVPGSHCTTHYCKVLGECAATRAACAEMRDSALLRIDTLEDAARVWAMLKPAEAALKFAREKIKAMALRAPIPLPDGKRLVVLKQEAEAVVLSAAAIEMVRKRGADKVLDIRTSKAAIEAALEAADAEQLIGELRRIGAIRPSPRTCLRPIKDHQRKLSTKDVEALAANDCE